MAGEPHGVDMEAIRRVIATADVFIVRFALLEHRLMVDSRLDSEGRPFVKMVPPVTSAEERYRYLQRERPGMPPPEQITVFQWPRSIRTLREAGLWAAIEERLVVIGGDAALALGQTAYRDALRLEDADKRAMILGGEGYETVWERKK